MTNQLTSKQRAALRSLANPLPALFQVGKLGITPELVQAVDEALEARELVKFRLLDNCLLDVREAAETLAGRTRSQVVQVIGGRFVLYRPNKKNPVIVLPKD